MNTQIDIPPALMERLTQAAEAHGKTPTEFALQTLAEATPIVSEVIEDNDTPDDTLSGFHAFHKRWVAIAESIPQEELDKLPHDGARNHDYYLYGAGANQA